MSRKTLVLLVLLLPHFNIFSQEIIEASEGVVSYITSQNVYVKFNSTKQISIGDTLLIITDSQLSPALVVTNISSISCVCNPIEGINISVNDKIKTQKKKEIIPVEIISIPDEKPEIVIPNDNISSDTVETDYKTKQKISGKLSIASYSNFSNTDGGNSQRMRYTLSVNAKNLGNSGFSVESYMSFVHSNKNWSEIQSDIFNGLKIYNLALKYESKNGFRLWFGRKINRKLSNIGAIDGLQIEKSFKSIAIGGFVGSRPDYMNYSYNFNLFQIGAYVSHMIEGKNGNVQTTLSFVDQENNWRTDRRFAYFQHSNSLIKNFYFIGTAELELYQNINGVSSSDINMTNLYLLLRYRPVRQVSLSLSYRSQSNMIYYETYKDFVEQMIDESNLQGIRFQVTYRPVKYLSIGAKLGYRNRKDDPRPSNNIYGYLSYSSIPVINASATVSVTLLETSYLSGNIYSLNLSRDIIPGKLYGGLSYRYVDYSYLVYESTILQHVGDVNVTWRIIPKLSFSFAYEGVFESSKNYNRLYASLIKQL